MFLPSWGGHQEEAPPIPGREASLGWRVERGHARRARALFRESRGWNAPSAGKIRGTIQPGAKADLVIVNPKKIRLGLLRDSIKALCEFGRGADVETVIVDGTGA
jgi:cytosine/adenosine deaminase-related metal-dependent hydrolase